MESSKELKGSEVIIDNTEQKEDENDTVNRSAEERKGDKENTLDTMFHCNDCTYKTKKEITLKKHINSKHNSQKCKICNIVMKTSMEMLKQVAQEHSKNIKEIIKTKEPKTN